MDEPKTPNAENPIEDIRVEPDISDTTIEEIEVSDEHVPPPRPASKFPIILAAASLLVSVGVAGAAAALHLANQQEIIRLSTEIAQLRVSLDLYARGTGAPSGAEALNALTERLTSLEEAQKAQTAAPSALPPIAAPAPAPEASAATPPTPSSAPTTATANNDDCLPPGMRLLVAAGDSYPICGQPVTVDVSMVESGYITLSDSTIVPSGIGVPLPNSACTISVTSGGDEAVTGYAEIRVTC